MEKIATNQPAISFRTEDYLGNSIDLNNYKGKRILLSFFRGASCPFCNLRVHHLIKQQNEFESQGIQIIAIFAASKEEIEQYAGQQMAPFPIIPDPELSLYQKYGIEESHSGMLKAMINPVKMINMMFSEFFNLKSLKDKPLIPADFLIDAEQNIYRTYYGKDFGDHLSIEDILSWKEK